MVMKLEKICEELLLIIPDIRWDQEGCRAIEEAVGILRKLEQEGKGDDIRPVDCMMGKE